MNNGPRTIALVGLGAISTTHVAALKLLPDEFHLVAACDPDVSKHDHLGCRTFASMEAMARETRPDAIVVATPPGTHYKLAREALGLGAHVLIEKPATPTLDEFDDLCREADKADRVLYSALHFSFGRELLWFVNHRASIDSSWGTVTDIECGFFDPYIEEGEVVPRARGLEGSWSDSGPNALSVVAAFCDHLSMVECSTERIDGYPLDVAARSRVSFRDRRTGAPGEAHIVTDWRRGISRKSTTLHYTESRERIELDHSIERVISHAPDGATRILFESDCPNHHMLAHYEGVYKDFARFLHRGQDNRVLGRAVVDATQLSR